MKFDSFICSLRPVFHHAKTELLHQTCGWVNKSRNKLPLIQLTQHLRKFGSIHITNKGKGLWNMQLINSTQIKAA